MLAFGHASQTSQLFFPLVRLHLKLNMFVTLLRYIGVRQKIASRASQHVRDRLQSDSSYLTITATHLSDDNISVRFLARQSSYSFNGYLHRGTLQYSETSPSVSTEAFIPDEEEKYVTLKMNKYISLITEKKLEWKSSSFMNSTILAARCLETNVKVQFLM